MLRLPSRERPDWQQLAAACGFHFHSPDGSRYWDERHYYQFTLAQVEEQLEPATAELHRLCLQAVAAVVADERWLRRLAIPESCWEALRRSWQQADPSLYSRLDLVYDGRQPPRLLENNADTPTSVYETGYWQWLWLEQQVDAGVLPRQADQFNSLQEKLVARFAALARRQQRPLWLTAMAEQAEDFGTVCYLGDCAAAAGIDCRYLDLEQLQVGSDNRLYAAAGQPIDWLFKLYPWEYLLQEEGSEALLSGQCQLLEPLWKLVLSNKGLLAVLWQLFPGHPNLLPAYFADDPQAARLDHWVRKPLYSREGANITIGRGQQVLAEVAGPYGSEGHVIQAACPLPRFGDSYTLIGSWLVDGEPAGIGIREDDSLITRDSSRFVPHIILG